MMMAWLRIDDGMTRHEKTVALIGQPKGFEAFYRHQDAMSWCSQGKVGTPRRDAGHIPDAALPVLGITPGIAGMLEAVGMWDRNGTGWLIHDWEDYQRVDRTAADRQRRHRRQHQDSP